MTERVSVERLRQVLRYDTETGKLFWLPRGAPSFDTRFAGKEAFTAVTSAGYRHGTVDGVFVLAHRVAFALHHGRWPTRNVDHWDTDPGNNRPGNLREATQSQNLANTASRRGSSSKYLGVSWYEPTRKWRARISKDGVSTLLGYFENEKDAAEAYNSAASLLHGSFARPNPTSA